MIQRLALAGLVAAALSCQQAVAENSTRAGDYTIHYNAFTADTLSPEVAQAYGFQRSKFRGLINVSVVKEEPGTTGKSVPASVDVNIVNITGQKSRLPMRELKDKDAYYYFGEFPVYNAQTVKFEIEAKPEGAAKATTVEMSQQFFTE